MVKSRGEIIVQEKSCSSRSRCFAISNVSVRPRDWNRHHLQSTISMESALFHLKDLKILDVLWYLLSVSQSPALFLYCNLFSVPVLFDSTKPLTQNP